jgi:putative heme-binding domain-containing protein
MKTGTLGLMALLGAFQAVGAQTPARKNPLGRGTEVVAAGRALYNQTCTACHGVDGVEGERAPALVGERRFFRLSENAIFETIQNGIPGTAMPAMKLPEDDTWRIVTFIRAMRSSASEVDVPGNADHGREIFAGKGGCLKCHMLNGKGGSIGPDLSNIGAQITLKRLNESLTQAGRISPEYRPITVVTKSGERIEGVAKNEDAFSVQMLDFHDRLQMFDRSELQTVEHGKTSLMPHNYDKVLSPEEYRDLVAMLARQVQVELHKKAEGEGEVGR